jgi:hypothetical protein
MVGHRVLPKVRLVGGVCSVAAHVAWERARRSPRRTELDTVPASAEQLTPEWLTAALCRTVPGARVTDLALGGGSDGSSARRSVTVAYNDVGASAGLPTAIFTKSTPRFTNRFVLGLTGAAGKRMLLLQRMSSRPEHQQPDRLLRGGRRRFQTIDDPDQRCRPDTRCNLRGRAPDADACRGRRHVRTAC